MTVKEVREKQLPDLDDEFAAEASEFETLEQLRDEIGSRIAAALEARADERVSGGGGRRRRRRGAGSSCPRSSSTRGPTRCGSGSSARWPRAASSAEAYLQMQGKTREEAVTDLEPDAERALRREATLAAVAEAEGIEVSDEEMLEALGRGRRGRPPSGSSSASAPTGATRCCGRSSGCARRPS